MEWLLLGGLVMMWGAFLIPMGRRRSEASSVEDFEHRMEQLAYAEIHGTAGRWIVTPRKGARFVGTNERHRARARERRRQVFVFLLESIGISFLIGLVPPLRIVWGVTLALVALLLVYTWLLLTIKARAGAEDRGHAMHAPPRHAGPAHTRYVADGPGRHARARFNGLDAIGEGDAVHVVVRAAEA